MTQASSNTDRRIQAEATDELAGMPGLDATHVEVSVKGGILTLAGQVGSDTDRLTATRTAGRVPGVRALADQLVICDPGSSATSDANLAELADRMLASAVDVPAHLVHVGVRGRVVTLSGEVTSRRQRDAASQAVRHLRGVIGLTNDIRVERSARP